MHSFLSGVIDSSSSASFYLFEDMMNSASDLNYLAADDGGDGTYIQNDSLDKLELGNPERDKDPSDFDVVDSNNGRESGLRDLNKDASSDVSLAGEGAGDTDEDAKWARFGGFAFAFGAITAKVITHTLGSNDDVDDAAGGFNFQGDPGTISAQAVHQPAPPQIDASQAATQRYVS